MVVYVADDKFDNEYEILKKRLAMKEAEIDRLKTLDSESHDVLTNRSADLEHVAKALDQKNYRIMQMTKKHELQEQKLHSLLGQLSDKEKEVSAALVENSDLRRKLNDLHVRFGIIDDSSDYQVGDDEEDADGVLGWGVTEVIDWWKRTLPKGAQQFVPMVEECHLTGKDLIELDKEMLEQLGIKKLLVMKILKQIEPLRLEANLPPRQGLDDFSDRGSKSAERGRSSQQRDFEPNRRSRSRGNGNQDSEYTGQAWWDADKDNAKDRVGITSV